MTGRSPARCSVQAGPGEHQPRRARDPRRLRENVSTVFLGAILLVSCGDVRSSLPREVVRARVAELAPAVNLGHRGSGMTVPGNPWPENSAAGFGAALAAGADALELDTEITADGRVIVMHDDRLDRTTTCSGCVSAWTAAEIRARCSLLDGAGVPTTEVPPTLAEAFAIAGERLVSVELKVNGGECLTATTGADQLTDAVLTELTALGVESRTLLSSFDRAAVRRARASDRGLYVGLLVGVVESAAWPEPLAWSVANGLDAFLPFLTISAEGIGAARDGGLQTHVWTVNPEATMRAFLATGVSGIITDAPGRLAAVQGPRG